MNSINWKGIDSESIEGLLICELPPISKPKMRIKETVIDGVDGSFIEELGYESYDKTMKIGLTRDYDIDEVMDYFNGEGNLIFSNEDDKLYKAKIINQIDYQRLLRFKTANITFRVQPFKYSASEISKKIDITDETSINFYNNGNVESKPQIKIYGTGVINFKLEGRIIFTYTFSSDDTYVVIDSDKQDAYVGSILKNRFMNGDFPIFQKGKNTISWDGTITKIEISNYSRWI
jgi:predicted phage tail component-like protein